MNTTSLPINQPATFHWSLQAQMQYARGNYTHPVLTCCTENMRKREDK
jgi:hypothetical protein